jgi:GAF domain-containing protein
MVTEDKIGIGIVKLICRSIDKSDDLEQIAADLTAVFVGTLGIKGCAIFAFNPETKELEMLANSGLSISYLNKGPVLASKSLEQESMDQPIVISNVSKSDRLQYPEHARTEGIGAIISLPIKLTEEFVGVLRLYHYETWDVSENDVDTLLLIAQHLGLVMMYARLRNALVVVKEAVSEVHDIWLG